MPKTHDVLLVRVHTVPATGEPLVSIQRHVAGQRCTRLYPHVTEASLLRLLRCAVVLVDMEGWQCEPDIACVGWCLYAPLYHVYATRPLREVPLPRAWMALQGDLFT